MRPFQDQISNNSCFGCGPGNAQGLRIKSQWENNDPTATRSLCEFQPEAHHNAGTPKFLNGGIIATVIDCHCVCTAIVDGYRRAGRAVGEGDLIWYATGSLQVNYHKPVPIDRLLPFYAVIEQVSDRKTKLSAGIKLDDVDLVTAEVLAVQVPAEWLASAE